ncbi:zinc-binding dehydrogenase [Streptomyces sp. NBC_00859]|uniref:zinc-binding dehydrogenase n=1 Tax=Streptomyces sp. NBC_00859 TaxID=2903682 RepID=UPI00386931D0|nr:NADP-dependent oxidoreductase [Streptomyces sp. NBC_00859]
MTVEEVRVARYPAGPVRAEDFEVAGAGAPPAPGDGQVLVALRGLGLNAGMATRIGAAGTPYGPGLTIGSVPASDAVVEVLVSRSDTFRPGDLAVRPRSPWRTADVADAGELRRIPGESADLPLETHLTVLGHVGFTAYTGMVHLGRVAPAETVYVSGAAGGVGSCAVQLAKAHGARVVGSAGSDEKVGLLTGELGVDAFNYRHGAALDLLRAAAPDGIDLFFDNIGGEQLEAALEVLNFRGRAMICGLASQYGTAGAARGPANYARLIYRELTLRGFAVTAHEDLRPRFEREVGKLVREGMLRSVHTSVVGFERTPDAFATLLAGGNSGRMIVTCARGM